MQKKTILKPNYYDAFRCIASACEDNCCMGWAVDIDQKTFQKYQKIEDPKLKPLIKKVLRQNTYCDAKEINYAYVKLTKAQNCSFLDPNRLCMIQKAFGETYLSNVCSLYPRIYNRINDKVELSLSPSCPEALRKYLFLREGIDFETLGTDMALPIITYDVDQNSEYYKSSPVAYLGQVRQGVQAILSAADSNKGISFRDSLSAIGDLVDQVKKRSLKASSQEMINFLKSYQIQCRSAEFLSYDGQVRDFTNHIMTILDVENQIFSERYRKFHFSAVNFYNSLKINNKNDQDRLDMAKRAFESFLSQKTFVMKNYFSNLLYRNIFPYTEADDIFDSYMLIVTRFLIIQHDLIGLIGSGHALTDDVLVAYFQSFSKAIDHHQSFFMDMTDYYRVNRYNTWQFIKQL